MQRTKDHPSRNMLFGALLCHNSIEIDMMKVDTCERYNKSEPLGPETLTKV